MKTRENFYSGKWASIVRITPGKNLVIQMCKIITHHEERDGDGSLYLGKVEDFYEFSFYEKSWRHKKKEDFTNYVFPFDHDDISNTKKDAQRLLIRKFFEKKRI